MGVHLDLVLKDEVNPLVGGKAHVELPVSTVWKFLEVDQPLLKPIIIALEKSAFGRIYDVMTVKADMTFNAERVLEGIFNVAVDYNVVVPNRIVYPMEMIFTSNRPNAHTLTIQGDM